MTQANTLQRRRGSVLGTCTLLVLISATSACDPALNAAKNTPEPGVFEATRDGPADAAPGTCWGKTFSPAVVETVSERIEVRPAKINPDGSIGKPPVYRTKERQVIVTARKDNWFQTPCPDELTPEFVASLQRAMQVRGIYAGAISGKLDAATRSAVQRMQAAEGLDSAVLSLETARKLGLAAVPRSPG